MSDILRRTLLLCMLAQLAACGQTGKLYLPDPAGEVVTRPATPPPETTAPPNSPQTVDSPQPPDTPTEREKKTDKKN